MLDDNVHAIPVKCVIRVFQDFGKYAHSIEQAYESLIVKLRF